MAHDAGAGVVGEHALQPRAPVVGAVGHDLGAGVDGAADAHAAAVVDGDPRRAAGATLSMALRMGQSAMASEPSRIDSVSRYGEATEPESRWSRPITIGAVTSPLRTSSLKRSPARWRSP